MLPCSVFLHVPGLYFRFVSVDDFYVPTDNGLENNVCPCACIQVHIGPT